MKRITRITMLLGFLFIVLALTPPGSEAVVIYDNGMDHIQTARLSTGNFMAADDFSIEGGGIVTDVHWLGAYVPNSPIPTEDNFYILIFGDDSGAPGAQLYSDQVTASRVDTGMQFDDFPATDVYSYEANISPTFTADPGTIYWLAIYNDIPVDGSTWWWAMDAGVGDGGQFNFNTQTWESFNDEHAFQVTGVPEPATMLLLGVGLVGIVGIRRKINT